MGGRARGGEGGGRLVSVLCVWVGCEWGAYLCFVIHFIHSPPATEPSKGTFLTISDRGSSEVTKEHWTKSISFNPFHCCFFSAHYG